LPPYFSITIFADEKLTHPSKGDFRLAMPLLPRKTKRNVHELQQPCYRLPPERELEEPSMSYK
jgi:hypothetical protein